LPLGLGCYVIRSACEGLAFAHQRSQPVIHADLSPSNVLVSRAGEVKVTDFGIARRVDGQPQSSAVEGKWPYMAPEQARGEPLSPLSDVFSMGIVLYQVISGHRPFEGKGPDETRQAILSADPPPLSQRRAEVPEALERLCQQALHKDPAERFQSMRALGTALGEVAFGQGWRDGPAELAGLVARRSPPPLRRTASLKVVLADLGVGAGRATRLTTPERPAARSDRGAPPAELQAPAADLTGSVVAPTPGELDGLTRWTLQPPPARGSRRLTVGAVILVAVAAVTFGYLAWAPLSPPSPGPGPKRLEKANTAIGTPVAAPFPAPDQGAGPAHAAAVAADAEAPATAVAADAAPSPSPDARSRRPRRRRGWGVLRLHAEPWGYVTIDGRKTGKSTPSVHRVRAGRHRVRITSPSTGLGRTLTVSIPPGQTITRSVQLSRER
jgi:hypothetical protein